MTMLRDGDILEPHFYINAREVGGRFYPSETILRIRSQEWINFCFFGNSPKINADLVVLFTVL